jgi:putative ABC transport system permease protein
MIWNFIKVAVRSLLRNRVFTAINVISLALGVTASILLVLYIQNELTYNRHYEQADDLYRVLQRYDRESGNVAYSWTISTMFAKTVRDQIPGIASMTQVDGANSLFRIGDKMVTPDVLAAEPSFFKTFRMELLEGDPSTALDGLHSIIVTKSFAEKHLPDGSPIGKMIEMQVASTFQPFEIRGVIEDQPPNTTLPFEVIVPYELFYAMQRKSYTEDWGMSWSYTYVRLNPDADPKAVEDRIFKYLDELGVTRLEEGETRSWRLQPVTEIHISIDNPESYPTEVDSTAIIVLSLIAGVILFIASINFTTLSIGRSTTRALEVGMRKVMGASRSPLVLQFWTETAALSLLALVFGLLITELTLPTFNQLAGRELSLAFTPVMLLSMLCIWLLLVFVAGSYPALVMSGFTPARAFKGELRVGGKSLLRRTLVLIQFSLSICLVAVTLVMQQQLEYIQNSNLGFNGDQILELSANNRDDTGERIAERLKVVLGRDVDFKAISGTAASMRRPWFEFSWEEPDGRSWNKIFGNTVMPGYLDAMGIDLIAGRGFTEGDERDHRGLTVIINEAMAEYMGWEDPIGQVLPGNFRTPVEVIGVIPDFHFTSLHEEIRPLMLMGSIMGMMGHEGGMGMRVFSYYTVQNILVRISPANTARALNKLEGAWNMVAPDHPFNPRFLDESIESLYREDKRWNTIVRFSSIVAMIIAALGLFGLSTLEVEQRRKEIGIRKVMGATVTGIVVLISRSITILVLGASIVALPIAVLLSNRWLENFAYRISVNPHMLALALLAGLHVSWLTVGGLAWYAAIQNPVNSLRHE